MSDQTARIVGRDVIVSGRNGTVGTSLEELYPYDQALNWATVLAAAAKLDLTSSSAADTYWVSKGTATMTIANPCVVTLSSHALITGDHVKFTTTGALPTGLTASTTYYAIYVDANTFKLATTRANAVAGTAIETTGTQSGTHTLFGPGTGTLVVQVSGLDANFNLITEDVQMNGQTIVTTAKSFRRVFGLECTESGTGLVNAGDIHCVKTGTGGTYTTGVPGTLTSAICKVLTGWGNAGTGMYTVPAGKTATLRGINFSCRGQACTFQIASQKLADYSDNSLHTDVPIEVNVNTPVWWEAENMGLKITWYEKTDIRIRALAAGASGIASGSLILTVS